MMNTAPPPYPHPYAHPPRWSTAVWQTLRQRVTAPLEFWLREIDPLWSVRETRARVMAIREETPDTRTFVLEPNARWSGHRAGQYAPLTVTIDGARVTRCYSIASAPSAPYLRVTVKRVEGGRVSGWMHDHLQVGDIVLLGEPMGTFVMPEEGVPERMLWIAGGSGVTPMLAMADALAERPEIKTSLVILYYARSRQDRIGYTRLRQAVSQIEGAQMVSICDDDPAGPGGFDEAHVRALVPDFAERHTWLCGPPGLMRCVEAMWTSAQALSLLQTERFTAPRPPTVDERPSTATPGELQQQTVSVTLAGRGRVVTANAQATLLEQLEQAGERPAHGCRMGICQSCRCRKVSGVVEDTLTGTLSREPDETIQLCISVPRSDLVLELHNTSRNPS